jgi:molecular chaperone DnaK
VKAVGIDFGTTNSAVAVLDRDGAPRILTTLDGATTMPSMVGFIGEGPQLRAVVGEPARQLSLSHPEAVVFGAKRLLGRRHNDPEVQQWARSLPFQVIAAPNGDAWVRVCGVDLSPQIITALILAELRRTAERFFGEPVKGAVITVPAWFDATQRQAIKDAAELAGLTVRRLIGEPTAAALGHGAHRGVDRRYAVVDLGGGTFDVSICDVAGGLFEVLATAGDSLLGGDDIDRVIVGHLATLVRTAFATDVIGQAPAMMRLRAEAQRVKHLLSETAMADVAVPRIAQAPNGKAIDLARLIRRDELELWAAPVIKRLEAPCNTAMTRAGVGKDEIDEVLLVGGMTRMPAVRRKIAQTFGREPTVIANPDEVVAVGAAIEVARLEGLIDGVLLLDVTARGLAIGGGAGPNIADGRCDVVIPQGSVVPTREHRLIATGRDGQRTMTFAVWEGESDDPARNRLLARYQVTELPDAPAGEVLVLVELTVDVDGTCRVNVTEMVSGERPPIQVIGQSGLARATLSEHARQITAWSPR